MLKFITFILTFSVLSGLMTITTESNAQEIVDVCPVEGVQPRPDRYDTDGIILTTFDRNSLWLVHLGRRFQRYPLEDSYPCGTNCKLSPDARWITYLDPLELTFNKMHLDGSQRTVIVEDAAEVSWWSDEHYLIWSPLKTPYLLGIESGEIQYLTDDEVVSIANGHYWAYRYEQGDDDTFRRLLVNLEDRRQRIDLGVDLPYFNAQAWSPDGQTFAYVRTDSLDEPSANLYLMQPPDPFPLRMTNFSEPTRIGGLTALSGLSWSPDGTKIAFWVTEADMYPPEANDKPASIIVLDVTTDALTRYCAYTTVEHTPNPPRLVWSPDSQHIAFAGNVDNDTRGYLLIALNTESGVMTELSAGIYPTLGIANVIAWGAQP